jgi:hypothetical protein
MYLSQEGSQKVQLPALMNDSLRGCILTPLGYQSYDGRKRWEQASVAAAQASGQLEAEAELSANWVELKPMNSSSLDFGLSTIDNPLNSTETTVP